MKFSPTLFDYLVLIILACSVIISLLRGLVKEILSLTGWILAFVIANTYGAQLDQYLPFAIPGDALRLMIGFVILLIGTRLLMAFFSKAIETLIASIGLKLVDRGLGGLFGLARGILIVLSLVLICGMTAVPQQIFWKKAILSPLAVSMLDTILPYLPKQVVEHVHF